MQRRWLEMQDYWTLTPNSLDENKKHLFECKDNKSTTGHSLLVRLAATHSAIVNSNKRFYRPDKMQAAVPTWLNKSVAAPVLREHNTKGDVYGRVRSAKYIDETHKYDLEFPILRDTTFYNTDSTRIPLFDSVDWISENLNGQDDYTGLGYIELGTQITDPGAIRKIFNDEFLTVSVGFKTDSAVCSICHTDWASEDKCNHRLGQKVDGKDAFLITGNLDYSEVSFVNFAADPFASIISINQFTDSLNKKFYLGLSSTQQQELVDAAGLTMSDSIINLSLDDDITVFYEDSMDLKTLNLDSLDSLLPEIKSKELTATKAFEFKNAIDSLTPESVEDKAKVRSVKSTLNSRIKKEKWTEVTDTTEADEMAVALETPAQEIVNTDAVVTNPWDNFSYSNDTEKAFFEDAEGIVNEIVLEHPSYVVTDSTPVEAFCGPNKSFAVVDGASASVCRTFVEKSPISQETKEKIYTCIDARETTLGLNVIEGLDSVQAFTDAKTGVPEKVVGHYGDLHTLFSSADKPTRMKMRSLHHAVGDHWATTSHKESSEEALINAGHNVNAYGDAIVALDKFYTDATEIEVKEKIVTELKDSLSKWDFNVVSSTELADKEETINELAADLTAEKVKSVAFFKECKKALASQIVMSKVLAATDGFKDLSREKIDEKIAELSARNIVSLRDSVKDILNEQKFLTNSGTDSQEITTRVAETTQVTEADTVALTDSKDPETTPEVEAVPARMLKYLSPTQQRLYLAQRRFGK